MHENACEMQESANERQGVKRRNPPKTITVNGIDFHYNDPPFQVGDIYRSRLHVCDPKDNGKEKKKNLLKLCLVEKSSPEKVEAEVQKIMRSFPIRNRDLIMKWICSGDLDPSLNNWFAWNKEELYEDLDCAESIEECDAAWNCVSKTMGEVRLSHSH